MKLPSHWTTKDKRSIPIREMSDAHLANALKLVERRIETTDEARDACYGHGFDGEMASYYAEQEASTCESHLSDLRLAERALSSEQQRRKTSKPPLPQCPPEEPEDGTLSEEEIQAVAGYRRMMRQRVNKAAENGDPLCAAYLSLLDCHPLARQIDSDLDWSSDASDIEQIF